MTKEELEPEASSENIGKSQGKTKVFFDVVNSVKGGSGKSTFSLLLAGYHASKNNTRNYIIDLDLRGTSWEKDYGYYIKTSFFEQGEERLKEICENDKQKYEKYPFVDKLMWNFERYRTKVFWSYIVGELEQSEFLIKLCPACAEYGENLEQLEIDIFENAIYQIIINEINYLSADASDIEEVHFIFDMPPSYEPHAERILNHLLTSINSPLYSSWGNITKDKFEEYVVNLYMLASVNAAHVEQNKLYIKKILKDLQISSSLINLIEQNRFFVHCIANDITNRATHIGMDILENGLSGLVKEIRNVLPESILISADAERIIQDYQVLPNITTINTDWYFRDTVSPDPIYKNFPPDAMKFFKSYLK